MGRPQADAGDGPHGSPGRRRGATPNTARRACWRRWSPRRAAQARHRLLSADRQLPGKTYAAGKIPGGFFKREGRPTEKETLTSRLIDRPIRPLFIDGFKHETQVVVTVLSHDMENDPDIVGMVAASAALTLSGVPFLGPIGGRPRRRRRRPVRAQPMIDEMAESDLDLVVAGTGDAVMMVESEAKELPEKQMLEAVMFGHRGFQPVIEAIIKLAEKAAKEPWDFQPPDKSKYADKAKALVEADLRKAFATPEKQKRHELVEAASAKVKKSCWPADADASEQVLLGSVFKGHRAGCRARRHHHDPASASTAAT